MEKPMINLVVAGHVDHGKSTLIGRLFEELNLVSKSEKEKAERDAKAGRTEAGPHHRTGIQAL
jgi:elongation factor 1-alpha